MAVKKKISDAQKKQNKSPLPATGAPQPAKGRKKKDPETKEAEVARKLQKIKAAFERDEIKTFQDIFDFMRPTPFGSLIGLQSKQIDAKVANPGSITMDDITLISNTVKVNFDRVCKFVATLVKDPRRKVNGKFKPLYISDSDKNTSV